MAFTFRFVGSVCCASALLFAAAGCSVEASAGEVETEAEIESTAEALSCDPSPFIGVCQSQCLDGRCTDGSAISSCMSACIGVYCSQQMFRPDPRCTSPDTVWMPVPRTTPPPSDNVCESDVLLSCLDRCDLCKPPTTVDRGPCQAACRAQWCPVGNRSECYQDSRLFCHDVECAGMTGEARYSCLARCYKFCDHP